jgi:hypothetical protein
MTTVMRLDTLARVSRGLTGLIDGETRRRVMR